eukprot:TRINITY_DN390_c0_g1_i1.p1 TRINITY_DN390_c0_g1~~TRINITY_DN390_c0_g1_i1.p1  ORF type:complete len:852 (+),score=165.88 TRINITY_DN390_c0_g1_i1:49-2556(+)
MDAQEEAKLRLRRDFEILRDRSTDSGTRIATLRKLLTVFKQGDSGQLAFADIDNVVAIISSISDQRDTVRERSVDLLLLIVRTFSPSQSLLSFLIPAMLRRIGPPQIREEVEEIVEELLKVLESVLIAVGAGILPFAEDLVDLLTCVVTHKKPEVQIIACSVAKRLASVAKERVAHHSERVCKSLMPVLNHRMATVRIAAIEAVGDILACGPNEVLKTILPALERLVSDQAVKTRKIAIHVVENWALTLIDRYSYRSTLLPLILVNVYDANEEISKAAWNAMDAIGAQYEDDNEERLRDLRNYGSALAHLRVHVEEKAPKPRPRLGARLIVNDVFSNVVPPLLTKLGDWSADTRRLAAECLRSVIIFAEDIDRLVPEMVNILIKAIDEDDKSAHEAVLKLTEVIGTYAQPTVYLERVLAFAKGAQFRAQAIFVLETLMRGCGASLLPEILPIVARSLVDDELCVTEDSSLQDRLCRLIVVLTTSAKIGVKPHVTLFMTALLQLKSFKDLKDVEGRRSLENAFGDLALSCDVALPDLWLEAFPTLLEPLQIGCESWDHNSPKWKRFDSLVRSAPVAAAANIIAVATIVNKCLGVRDGRISLEAIALLDELFASAAACSHPLLQQLAPKIIVEIVLPLLVWRAGRVATFIRTIAIKTVQHAVRQHLLTNANLKEVNSAACEMLTQAVVTALDKDEPVATRTVACVELLPALITDLGPGFSDETVMKLYPAITSRLDDAEDKNRIAACEALTLFMKLVMPHQQGAGALEYMIQQSFIHLDDNHDGVRAAVATMLRAAADLNPEVVLAHALRAKQTYLHTKDVQEIVEYVSSKSVASDG